MSGKEHSRFCKRRITNMKMQIQESRSREVAWTRLLGGFLLLLLLFVAQSGFAQTGLIAYTTPDPLIGPDANQLWLVNSNGTNNHRLTPRILLGGIPALTASLGRPAWSKDGTRIAADALLTGGDPYLTGLLTTSNVLVVFNPATGQGNAVFNTTTGTGPVALDWFYKAFSPDGKRLVYGSNQLD